MITRTNGSFTGKMVLPGGKVIAPTGKAFDLDFTTTAKWDGDLLIEEFVFWDSALQARQIGLADSATTGDYDVFRTTWADDAEFIIGKGPQMQSATGVDDAVAMLRRLRTGRDFFVMFALPGVIEINGDEATTRTFCHESARGPGEKYYRNHCVAFDRLRRSGDDWVFKSRSFQYLWLDTSPFSGDGFPLFPDRAAV